MCGKKELVLNVGENERKTLLPFLSDDLPPDNAPKGNAPVGVRPLSWSTDSDSSL